MCGRLDVNGDQLNEAVQVDFSVKFHAETNRDLKPTQTVSTLALRDGQLQQLDTRWGIKPHWSTSLIINAKSETVTERQTFVKAFAFHRCLVPCTGFYEWRPYKREKIKLWFHREDARPLYMAAFWYEKETPELVTLTRAAPYELMHIHNRFPVFIAPQDARIWLAAAPQRAQAMTQGDFLRGITFDPIK